MRWTLGAIFSLLLLGLAAFSQTSSKSEADFDPAIFLHPPAKYRGHAMWNFNLTTLNENGVVSGIEELAKLNYGGFFIEAGGGPTTGLSQAYLKMFPRRRSSDQGVVFLSDEYFRYYRLALEEAKKLGLEVILYDDYSFPTGTVAGQMYSQYPQYIAKTLNMAEEDITGPSKADLQVPNGIYVGSVLMNRDNFDLLDVSDKKTATNHIICQAPKGRWKLMSFYLVVGRTRVVDYLDETAMTQFISMTYEKYNKNFGQYFGNLITQTFYDEPAMHQADRTWTPDFNTNFQKRYGYSPMKYYPALWYDIGPQTVPAREALFGFRAQLFADNFIKRLNDWCAAHNLLFGGHLDQEEDINPTPVNGDPIKIFEHQAIPTVDDIWWYGRSNPSYKIVTSAAFNFDKPIARAETYAAYRILDEKIAFQVAMDQFAMGVNFQIPARTPQPKRPELNEYVGRLSYLLEHGRHVSDIAVLYPIASLQPAYKFLGGVQFPLKPGEQPPDVMEVAYAREGGLPPAGSNYQDIGEALFRGLRVDYTYLHPEVLINRCTVDKHKLILNNEENREEYSVLIIPSGKVISADAAAKIEEFYNAGGSVIAIGELPTRSAEFGRDKDVQRMVADVFGVSRDEPLQCDVKRAQDRLNFYVFWYYIKQNKAGGRALVLPTAHPWLIDFALKQVLPVRDVDIQEPMAMLKRGPDYDGALTYIHKVKDGRDIYFFANSTAKPVDTKVVLRGQKTLTIWNPHTGEQEKAEFSVDKQASSITTLHLTLPPISSRFFIEDKN